MANSRKDSRGYVLKTGEFQRKDGRYSYSYTDKEGKRHTVYENSLAELRKKERQIIRDIEDGIDAHAPEKITLNDLWDKYIGQKYDLKPTTRANYKYCYDRYVRDGLLRSNPSDGVMAEIKKSHVWNISKKCALTVVQQKAFTNYIRESKDYQGWTPVLMILLGTGMRIGECLGLRWDDLDFENRTISVNHNITDRPYEDGTCAKHIQTPKTRAGACRISADKHGKGLFSETVGGI